MLNNNEELECLLLVKYLKFKFHFNIQLSYKCSTVKLNVRHCERNMRVYAIYFHLNINNKSSLQQFQFTKQL